MSSFETPFTALDQLQRRFCSSRCIRFKSPLELLISFLSKVIFTRSNHRENAQFGFENKFIDLQVSNRPDIASITTHVWDVLNNLPGKLDGLAPIFINSKGSKFANGLITLGARGDSYYEYMLKQYIARGRRDTQQLAMYIEAMGGVRKHLIRYTSPLEQGGLVYISEWNMKLNKRKVVVFNRALMKMDHLVCFVPGLLALGSLHGVETGALPASNNISKPNEMRIGYHEYNLADKWVRSSEKLSTYCITNHINRIKASEGLVHTGRFKLTFGLNHRVLHNQSQKDRMKVKVKVLRVHAQAVHCTRP